MKNTHTEITFVRPDIYMHILHATSKTDKRTDGHSGGQAHRVYPCELVEQTGRSQSSMVVAAVGTGSELVCYVGVGCVRVRAVASEGRAEVDRSIGAHSRWKTELNQEKNGTVVFVVFCCDTLVFR